MSSVNPFEALLAPEEEMLDTPEKQRALAAGLRRQHDLGTLFQLMGLPPTVQAGQSLQKQAMGGLDLALGKQSSAAESKRRAMERAQSQENWQRDFSADQAYRAAQLGLDRSQEQRLRTATDPEEKKQWAVDPYSGRMYNQITGEWRDSGIEPPAQKPGPGPRAIGFEAAPPGLKMTETQEKSRYYAQNMAQSLPRLIMHLQEGYRPTRLDILAAGPPSSGVGGLIQRNVPRGVTSPAGREFYTEGRTVLAAILRKESGAAITDDEWTNYGPMWLPWPGDSDEEIDRKLVRLESAMQEMAMGAGPAARYWQPPETGTRKAGSSRGAGSGEEEWVMGADGELRRTR